MKPKLRSESCCALCLVDPEGNEVGCVENLRLVEALAGKDRIGANFFECKASQDPPHPKPTQ